MEPLTTMASSKPFLGLPYEIRVKIYKEVFVGSQIYLHLAKGAGQNRFQSQEDPSLVLEYEGPEGYNVLLLCSQIKNEATPILTSSLRLKLTHDHNLHARFSINFFQLEQDPKAPAFLRQAIPSIKCIRFASNYASRLQSDLRAFPKLQSLQIYGLIESYGSMHNAEVRRDPLVLLQQAHDRVFLDGMIRALKTYTIITPGSYFNAALDNSRPYTRVWKGRVAFSKPPVTTESVHTPTNMTVHFEIDLGEKTLLRKRFSYGTGYRIFADPQQFLREGHNARIEDDEFELFDSSSEEFQERFIDG